MTAGNQYQAMRLLDLPNEILADISSLLCVHCQLIQSADIDQDTTAAALKGQLALARLSRCSKPLQRIAQPVLFHFFCSERPPPVDDNRTKLKESDIEAHITTYTRAVDLLSDFIRTIVYRPDLKTEVRVLTLYTADIWDQEVEHERVAEIFKSQHAVIEPLYREALSELEGGVLVDATRRILTLQIDFQDLEDLQDLALAVCRSTLEDLLLERAAFPFWSQTIEPPESKRWEWDYELPRLARLSLPGTYNARALTCGIESAQYFLHHAPSLRVFVAPDCEHLVYGPGDSWAVVMLPCLTRLSVTGLVNIPRLVEILNCCPALEELEYQNPIYEAFEPAIHIDAVKGTIRRLCFSSIGLRVEDLRPSKEDDWRRITLDQMCLSSYPRLEVLEIDRSFLFGENRSTSDEESLGVPQGQADAGEDGNVHPDNSSDQDAAAEPKQYISEFFAKTTAEGFLRILPPALRVLRVGFVRCWPAMYRDALALATQAPERFPRLRDVSIIVAREAPEGDVRELGSLFSASGIVASVGPAEMYRGDMSRGLLPPRPRMTILETRGSV